MKKRALCFLLAMAAILSLAAPAYAEVDAAPAAEPEDVLTEEISAEAELPPVGETAEPAAADVPAVVDAPAAEEEPAAADVPAVIDAALTQAPAPEPAENNGPASPTDTDAFVWDMGTATDAKSVLMPAPKLLSVEATTEGILLRWEKMYDTQIYRVLYKTGSKWKTLKDVAGTEYLWKGAKSGTKYSFTIRCRSADGKKYISAYDKTGKSVKYLSAPKIKTVSVVSSGIKISWGKVSGAAKYRVYYKDGDGWKKIADTKSTSYTWKKAEPNRKYIFGVQCVDKKGKSTTSPIREEGVTGSILATPQLTAAPTPAGIQLTWAPVEGAAKYRVMRKSGSKWKTVADVADPEYLWTGAKSGSKYTFTVRCVSADGKALTSGYTSGKRVKYLSAPKIKTVSVVSSGIKISWGKVSGAAKYRVYYKDGDGWKKIADTKSTSYTWKKAEPNREYIFGVQCVDKKGKSTTSPIREEGVAGSILATPQISGLTNTSQGVHIQWDAVPGAAGYVILRKSGSSWKKLGTTTGTDYTWGGGKNGKKYTFTVRCANADGSAYTSGYNTTGKKIKYSGGTAYVLNTSTMKFHRPSCRDVPRIAAENRADVKAYRSELIADGYSSCGHCDP